MTSSETRRVEVEGYRAFSTGRTPRHNPYSWKDEERCKAWIRGHAAARTDRIAHQLGQTPPEHVLED
ncbi:ribosome modulation factor [Sinomonas soli]